MANQCGGIPPTKITLASVEGYSTPLLVTGTDPDIGGTVNQIVDMSTQSGDFIPAHLAHGGTFLILIETAAAIKVQLADESDFTISSAYATTYLGDWIPMPLLKVYKSGSTGTFSVGF